MAITSVDSYLLSEIKPRLNTVLENCYIIDEVLKDFDYQTRESFKEAFCGKNAQHEVTVGFNFPKFKNNYEAHYLIQLGQGQETKNSLGSIQSSYFEATGDTLVESSTAIREDDKLVFTVSKPIGELIKVEDIEFAKYDNLQVEGNKVSFKYQTNEDYENYNANIIFTEKKNDSKGLVKGFTVEEQVTVVGLSFNVDVARCLDAVLKMILISMRDSIEEQQTFQLQNLSFGDIAPIIEEGDSMIFGRPTIIKYTSSLDLDYTITQDINKLTFKERKDWK
ncbi:hypothetical protein [Staphylococcus phage LJT-1]|nr:hypothetical protein [Staphylococcus phage LJT-1]